MQREFWIRVDEKNSKARLHEFTCRHCAARKKHGEGTVKWLGPYSSVRFGLLALDKLDAKDKRWHDQCCAGKCYSVYVIRLSERAWKRPDIRKANPHRNPELPCVYVGRTNKDPEERFEEHKAGIRSGKGYVRDYGEELMLSLCRPYDTCLTYDESVRFELELAEGLRKKGYAVWQN